MLVQIRDKSALSALPIINLRSYLQTQGWTNVGPWGERPAIIYAKEEAGRDWEILVPTRDTLADFAESMAESIAVLAEIEERSQLDVFHDLSASGADVIRLRSSNGQSGHPLSLRQSSVLLNDAFDLLASAARAAERPQATYRGKMSSDVAEYLDQVRPLPGYERGFGLTLHSPVPAGVGQQDLGDDFAPPFPRQTTIKLAQALEFSRNAVSEVVADGTIEPFRNAVDYGVSANLCNSVAELAKQAHGIDIELAWAEVRPSNIADSHFQFSASSADVLQEVAKSFRFLEPSYDEQIIAQVVRLEREVAEFDGRAVIVSVRDGRPTRMSVEFQQSVYELVINAFRDHAPISMDGDVHPEGRSLALRNPRNVVALSAA